MAIIATRKNKFSDIIAFYKEVNSREEDVTVAEFLKMMMEKFNLSSVQRSRDYFYKIQKMIREQEDEEEDVFPIAAKKSKPKKQ